MKILITLALLISSLPLFAQDSGTPPAIPEEARKHFVMGETMFKEAKSADNFTLAAGEFKQAADLAPQWPDPRYNLALAKESAGDYAGAMADLKLYQQFKLSDTEARTVQDKIYAIDAKQQLKASDAAAKSAADAANAQAAAKAQTDSVNAQAVAQAAANAAREKAARVDFIKSISGDWKDKLWANTVSIDQSGDDDKNMTIKAHDSYARNLQVSDVSLTKTTLLFTIHSKDNTGFPDRLLKYTVSLHSNGHLEGSEDDYWSKETIELLNYTTERSQTEDCVFIRQ